MRICARIGPAPEAHPRPSQPPSPTAGPPPCRTLACRHPAGTFSTCPHATPSVSRHPLPSSVGDSVLSDLSIMASSYDDIQGAWGAPAPPASQPADDDADVSVASAIEKERIIKDCLTLRDGLRGLLVRITEVQAEADKLAKDNEFLGTYIDNL